MHYASRVLSCACLSLLSYGGLTAAETVTISLSRTGGPIDTTFTAQVLLASGEPFNAAQAYLEWDPALLDLVSTTGTPLRGNDGNVFTAIPAAIAAGSGKQAFFTPTGTVSAGSGLLMTWTFKGKANGIAQIRTRQSTPTDNFTKLTSNGVVRYPAAGPMVTYNVGNIATPPNVNAGSDQTIILPASASLTGQVSSGTPGVTYAWTKVSGPGTVTFTPGTSTTATFSAAGVYVLRLTATNGAGSTSDDITITVQPAGSVNTAPVVDAGVDQTIALPNTAALNPTVSDDGLPAPAALSYAWTKVSGPGSASFLAPTAKNTSAIFSSAGTYVLQLAVSDGLLTRTDTVTITVTGSGGGGNPGDLNGDKVVNITDLTLVTSHFGQSSSHPSWNPLSDSNGDGVVNITDLTAVTSTFGRTYP